MYIAEHEQSQEMHLIWLILDNLFLFYVGGMDTEDEKGKLFLAVVLGLLINLFVIN